MTRVKYGNTLPDLPFDPKFISYPFSSNRFVEYSTTSLEKNYKYDVLTEIDLGVDVELVIPNFYDPPKNANLPFEAKDEKLLDDDNLHQKKQTRSRHHAKSVSWLRRTEYISTEQTRFQPQTIDKVEAKVGYSIKKSLKEDMHYMDRDSQVRMKKSQTETIILITIRFCPYRSRTLKRRLRTQFSLLTRISLNLEWFRLKSFLCSLTSAFGNILVHRSYSIRIRHL